jgi:phosphotransferase system HPr (HPr) family protein
VVSQRVVLREEHGLHARPAARIVETCRGFKSKITFCNGCNKADGCSILQLMMLAAKQGSELEIIATGDDELHAIARIAELFDTGAGI